MKRIFDNVKTHGGGGHNGKAIRQYGNKAISSISKSFDGVCELYAFTLAEVLITLAIIGVVAALTIPTVIANYQKKQTVVKLKKAYTTLSQAFLKSSFENGEKIKDKPTNNNDAKYYLENYWLRYFNVANVVPNNVKPYPSGDLPYKYYLYGKPEVFQWYLFKTVYSGDILRFCFTTTDGTLYFMFVGSTSFCGSNNAIFVDINGTKKPNFLGKDVFLFCTNFNKKTIGPYRAGGTSDCVKKTDSSKCGAKIMEDNWQIKSNYPW